MDFPHLVEAFLQHGVYLRNWSPRTVRTYRQGLTVLGTALPSPETPVAKAHLHALVVRAWHPVISARKARRIPLRCIGFAVAGGITPGSGGRHPTRQPTAPWV